MGSMEEPAATVTVTKSDFEGYLDGETLTDTQWEAVCDEIQGRLENFLEGLHETLAEDVAEGFYG